MRTIKLLIIAIILITGCSPEVKRTSLTDAQRLVVGRLIVKTIEQQQQIKELEELLELCLERNER